MTIASFTAWPSLDIVRPSPQHSWTWTIEFEPARRKPGGFSFFAAVSGSPRPRFSGGRAAHFPAAVFSGFPLCGVYAMAVFKFRNSPMVGARPNAYHEHQ
ncbi:hypothetical protein Herbaro_07305 [Herbaspirillum sp. WKF16]|uniref:hypothetical protein n=1 Tax=Herbaspirillum sp. WKF16 TaxID=3028312 RepID=UPI0023A9E0CC|nr:hypothetical protein [Herbaspirillum sp. WKF16]WDZ97589.1 hypothetical protein Herbaro_07305 [Herbaspirillum sp. WKF16]